MTCPICEVTPKNKIMKPHELWFLGYTNGFMDSTRGKAAKDLADKLCSKHHEQCIGILNDAGKPG